MGSRSIQKAQDFVDVYASSDPSVKAYGSYKEIYADDVSGLLNAGMVG